MKRILGIAIGTLVLFCLLFVGITPQDSWAALTKTENSQALEWSKILGGGDGTTWLETGTFDISAGYETTLHIDCCISEAGAHTGTEIIVQIASEAGVDDSWTTLTTFLGPTGTAVTDDIDGANTAGELPITDPAASGCDNDNKFIFIEDTGTIANSTIGYQVSNTGDASDTVTLLDTPLTTDSACDFYTIDDATSSVVGTYPVRIPASATQARVIFNNEYDADGMEVHVRVRATFLTGI